MQQPDPIKRLIHAFSRLPGIGEKTATRLAFFVLDADEIVPRELAESLRTVGDAPRGVASSVALPPPSPLLLATTSSGSGFMVPLASTRLPRLVVRGLGLTTMAR